MEEKRTLVEQALDLFGFRVGRSPEEEKKLRERIPSPITPPPEDAEITVTAADGVFGSSYLDTSAAAKNEINLINKYRAISLQPEAERAIDDIVNEAIVIDKEEPAIQINLDDLKVSAKLKKTITEEFEYIMKLLDFQNKGYDIFKNWYVDGRLYYHKMIDVNNPRDGLRGLRYIDPRKIKKIREEVRSDEARARLMTATGVASLNKMYHEYFLYNENGVQDTNQGIKIAKDSITFVHSGILNENSSMILSHLHKALKPYNQLRWLEDALVVYRLARAPERRVFYIDVGNLPKTKAEQYLREMMVKHKNKLTYDASTGEIRDDRRFMTMLEDFWLPRREGGRGTEISTLEGGQNLGEIQDVEFFQRKFYQSLNVPMSRIDSETQFNFGRPSEITRDELKFTKFVFRLRTRFSMLLDDVLGTHLILKGITDKRGWKEIKEAIRYDFNKDNYFSELKNQELLSSRFELLRSADEYVGRYYSINWVRKHILQQTEEDIKLLDREMEDERKEHSDDEFDTGFGGVTAPNQPGNQPPGHGHDEFGPGGQRQPPFEKGGRAGPTSNSQPQKIDSNGE